MKVRYSEFGYPNVELSPADADELESTGYVFEPEEGFAVIVQDEQFYLLKVTDYEQLIFKTKENK